MAISDNTPQAVHLEGGNLFNDLKIDIARSHRQFDHLSRKPKSIKQPRLKNLVNLYFTGLTMRLNMHEALAVNGIRRGWFEEFKAYWSNILNGRPLWNTLDFFLLLYDYRTRQQHTTQLEWSSPDQHLVNWQHPNQIYATLQSVRKLAVHPIVSLRMWKHLPKRSRILEYGCSAAPYYYCYRNFFSHMDCRWTLVDIPNYPFHYARYLYRNDAEVEFITINAEDFSNPLGETANFDVVILTTVLEHLDEPYFVTEYLLERLNKGGIFVFDYIKSEGKGLDHPQALAQRVATLKLIQEKTELVTGNMENLDQTIGLCIARKSN